MSNFDNETVLNLDAEGNWQGVLSEQWNIGDNPNGGFMMTVAMRALSHHFPLHGQPISVTTHYMRPGLGGEACTVETEVLRKGRTTSSGRARLIQAGKVRLEVSAVFGLMGTGELSSPPLSLTMPDIPSPANCVQRSGAAQGVELAIRNRLDTRLHPDQAEAGASGRAMISGWIRFTDERPVDCLSVMMFADAFPPSLFGLFGNIGWVPTIELTVHVRRKPQPGWILGQFVTEDLQDGRLIENGVLWDEAGHLIAQSRQLALLIETPEILS